MAGGASARSRWRLRWSDGGGSVTGRYDTGMTRRQDDVAKPWIDTGEFARRGSALSATQPAADFARLRDLLADEAGTIGWELAGSRRPRPEGGSELFMRLRLTGDVAVACTRCLQPVRVHLDEERLFKLALTESQAEREDAQADDYDVLAGSPRFDVLELVEDEAIMALPIAPRHERCSLPGAGGGAQRASAGDEDGDAQEPVRENPFAVLHKLRKRDGGREGG